MDNFRKLLAIHNAFRGFNAARSIIEYGILVNIGAGQFENSPLNVKQVVHLNLGPKATVERTIKKLILEGKVLQISSDQDKRTKLLILNEQTIDIFREFCNRIEKIQ